MRTSGVLQTLIPGSDDKWLGPLVHMEVALGFWFSQINNGIYKAGFCLKKASKTFFF
jgi:hypothetical protein